jgi:hypothetical protein
MRIEGVVGAINLIRQNRQHDKSQHGKLQHSHQIAARESLRYSAQLGFEIEQGGDAYCQHHGQLGKTKPDHRTQPVTQQ